MKTFTRPPQTDWEAKRMGRFTASNIYKLLTESRTKGEDLSVTAKTYIHQVCSEIVTGCIRSLDGYSLDWGLQNEPFAAEKIEKLHENFVYLGSENQIFFPYNSFSGGSPDGICEETKSVYEIKCPENFENHIEYCLLENGEDLKKFRKDYYSQIQFNMMCYSKALGSDFMEMNGYFISYCPNVEFIYKDFHIIDVKPDSDFFEKINAKIHTAGKYLEQVLTKMKL